MGNQNRTPVVTVKKGGTYKNQPKKIREKATEIANEVLKTTGNEGEAIATGLKQARIYFKNKERKHS